MADQNTSPYDLEQLIRVAQSKLILVAQNHWFMTSATTRGDEKFWPLVSDALFRGVQIDIVAMHESSRPRNAPENIPSAIDLWSLYLGAGAFRKQAQDTWEILEQWALRYRRMVESEPMAGGLRFYGAYFTPLTISIVDPDEPRGFLILSPRVSNEASGSRPHFIIRRQYEEKAFKYYYQTIQNSFGNAGWVEMFAPEKSIADKE